MMSEEWPVATPVASEGAPARVAGGGRLSTVRTDFFLDPAQRLTEQERALMTSMLHCLVGDIAGEIRAALPSGWIAANDDDSTLVELLTRAALLDDAELMSLLLRRADEERIGAAARARTARREARALQGLVSHANGDVSAAAMALILARGRRRDRFGQCLLGFDDLSNDAAAHLVHSIAAALRQRISSSQSAGAVDFELSSVAARLLESHDSARSIEALTEAVVVLLDDAGALSDELLLACAQEGEVGFIAFVLGRRAKIPGVVVLDELLLGKSVSVMALLRIAGFSRELGAGLLASIGDLLGIGDPGAAIGAFDEMTADQVNATASWLAAAPGYRAAAEVLGTE